MEHGALSLVEAEAIAGTTTLEGTGVDMSGYEGVVFFTNFATPAANNTIKAQGSSDDGSADAYADLAGTSVAVGASDELTWLQVVRPRERFVRPLVLRGTSTVTGPVWAFRWGARNQPVDNAVAGTIAGETIVSPAEGTA